MSWSLIIKSTQHQTSNHTSKKNFDVAKDIVRSNLAAKSDLIALKADKVDINILVSVPTGLNNLKTKVNDLDEDKLKTVHVDF